MKLNADYFIFSEFFSRMENAGKLRLQLNVNCTH